LDEPPGVIAADDDLSRKVRAPQGRVVGNAHPGRPAGQCHRKQTAEKSVRVKRWGKSSPRHRWRCRHGKPHPEQGQEDREVADVFEGCPPERPGRPRSCKAGGRRQRRSQMDDHRPPWGHRTRLTRVARPHLLQDDQVFCISVSPTVL